MRRKKSSVATSRLTIPISEMPDKTKTCVEFIWDRKQLFDQSVAEAFYDKVRQNSQALVLSVQGSEKSRWRPLPLSTIEFQKLASRKLKIPSHRAMEIAEKLYTKGFISYPRTETDRFPNTINLQALVQIQLGHSAWGEYAHDLLNNGLFQFPRMGSHDDKAHPPIHPVRLYDKTMGNTNGQGLAHDEYRIYELITRHFLACCSKDAKGVETTVRIDINTETFHTSGLIIKEYNWLLVYAPYEKWNAKILPDYKPGHVFIPTATALRESKTTPPQLINEPELITLMDKTGIGTDATIHEHIKTIQDRGYSIKTPTGHFEPTTLGVALVSAYERMGIDLWKPNLRAAMERNMTLIANGQMTKEEFLQPCLEELEQIFQQIVAKKDIMVGEVAKFYEASTAAGNYTIEPGEERKEGGLEIECGSCEQKTLTLYYLSNERRVMSCMDCQLDLKIPKKGEITALDFKCPICSFQVLRLKNEGASSSYTVCPWCYNSPPATNDIEDMPGAGSIRSGLEAVTGMPCFKCPSTDCEYSMASQNQKLMPCTSCRKDHITIKKSKKGTYFLGCSGFPQCKNTIFLSDQVVGMKILQKECPKCKLTKLVKLTFKNVNLLENTLSVRVSMEEGDEFCLAGCDNNDLSSFGYNYDCRNPTAPVSNLQQRLNASQTQLITQTQNRNLPSRMGTQAPTNSLSGNSMNISQLAANSTGTVRRGINILGNTSRLINNGIVQDPSVSRTMSIETSSRSVLNENKGTGIRIAYEDPRENPNQTQQSGNRPFELCTRCKKTGHSAESCPSSQLTGTQGSGQLSKAFRSPSVSAKPTQTIGTTNNARTIGATARPSLTPASSGRSSSSSATFPAFTNASAQARPKENLPPSNNLDAIKATSTCYKCQQVGHWANACPNSGNPTAPRSFGDNTNTRGNNFSNNTGAGNQNSNFIPGITCYKCKKPGHYATKCPESGSTEPRTGNYNNSGYNNSGYNNSGYGGSTNARSYTRDEYDEYADFEAEQPPPRQQPQGGGGPKTGECFICKKPGHWANACPERGNNTGNRTQQSTPARSYGQNGGGTTGSGLDLSTITCYRCQQKGHFATKCPTLGMQSEDGPSNNSFQGKRNYTSFQSRNTGAGGGGTNSTQAGAGKTCPECGQVGRHTRGSNCPSVKRKKTKPQDDEYD